MEAQDRYIKKGQKLYRLIMKQYMHPEIYTIKIIEIKTYLGHIAYSADDKQYYFVRDIGNKIFITYEEAERKGKEKQENLMKKKTSAEWKLDHESYIRGRIDEREELKKKLRKIYEEE